MSALSSAVDPNVRTAIRKDGIGNGRIRTELAAGELVFVPWTYAQDGVGTSPTSNAFAAMNADKSGTYILMESGANGFGTNYGISGYFRGRSFGIRFDPSTTSATSPNVHSDMGVMIDRVGYQVPKQAWNPWTQARQSDPSGSYGVIITRDLSDGLHHFEIDHRVFTSSANAAYIMGLLLEKAAGYRDPVNFSMRCNPYDLGTSNQTMMGGFTGSFRVPRGLVEMTYYNTSGSAITVTWRLQATDYYVFSLAAGESRTFQYPIPIAGNHFSASANNYMHRASATGVKCTAVGV
jgi:hypothetical protein